MARESKIQWTNSTLNLFAGCKEKSPGCRSCYARNHIQRMSGNPNAKIRAANTGLVAKGGARGLPLWTGEHGILWDRFADHIGSKTGSLIFVNSLSDTFWEAFENEEIAALFGVMAAAPQNIYQVLTKRADRMRAWFEWFDGWRPKNRFIQPALIEHAACMVQDAGYQKTADKLFKASNRAAGRGAWPLPNVILGVSVESQDYIHRLRDLIACPAAMTFVSAEPLLGPLDFSAALPPRPVFTPWEPGQAPQTWAEVTWPAWVPGELRAEIERFWGADARRGPQDYEAGIENQMDCGAALPQFGQVATLNVMKGEMRTGRYVHAWNNMGRVVAEDGSVAVVSIHERLNSRRRPLTWCVWGGESGRDARTCRAEWLRDGIAQCRRFGVKPFVKQLGDAFELDGKPRPTGKKGANFDAWPEDLKVREMPEEFNRLKR